VAQDESRVEVYRHSSGWDLEVFSTGDIVRLASIGSEIPIESVYEGVDLVLDREAG